MDRAFGAELRGRHHGSAVLLEVFVLANLGLYQFFVSPLPSGPKAREPTRGSLTFLCKNDIDGRNQMNSRSIAVVTNNHTAKRPLAVKNAALSRDRSPGRTIQCW